MPNKSIYVSDADMPLIQRAQQLAGGNLSAAIAQALRRYVEASEMAEQGYRETAVNVGPPGTQLRKRFFGLRLARWEYPTPEGYLRQLSVYRTPKNSLVLYVHVGPDRGAPSAIPVSNAVSKLEVLHSVEELADRVPEEFYLLVKDAMTQPPIEDVDV